MSQFPSPNSPHRPVNAGRSEAPRRLLTPEERFGTPEADSPEHEAPPINDPFVAEAPDSPSRVEDEMARRHLPPHLRRKHEKTLKKRQKRDARLRVRHQSARHEQRAEVEREFAANVRSEAPQPRKKPRRRMILVLKRLFLVVCLLFCVQLVVAAFSAPQFQIKSVSIVGAEVTPQDQVRALSAKLIGQNVLRVDHKAVEEAVETLPTVSSASVVRLASWPPKVELRIIERQPILKVGSGNDWWVVDQNGVPFRRPLPEDSALYAVVAPEFKPALRQKLDPKAWKRAAALNAAILADNQLVKGEKGASDSTAPFWHLRRIYFDKNGLASLRLVGKGALAKHNEMLLRLGDEQWAEKLARARVTLSYFDNTGRHAEELDLVSLDHPVWLQAPAQLAVKTAPQEGLKSTDSLKSAE